ncbi:hypothetical protein IV203_000752 [Nitzschia inconspicua]|uniref:Uncharacterized protein n=1 Tax=Nitzschia inconspicua TaxID=303405 RepID=A0A9K3PQZ7_9STRA|nr:hypothetical protein IV203_000752 [Nitzschia inconspicua]
MSTGAAAIETGGGNDSTSHENDKRSCPSKPPSVDASLALGVKPKASPKKKRKIENTTPTHILMALPMPNTRDENGSDAPVNGHLASNNSREKRAGQQRTLHSMDAHIQNDYIAKRKRAYESSGWDTIKKVSTPPILIQHPWDGVSKVERDLVECCELPLDVDDDGRARNPKNEYGEIDIADSDEYIRQRIATSSPWFLGGVLAVEHEVRFASILATECQNVLSKSLALAILERTLEVYLKEKAAEEEEALKAEKLEDETCTEAGDENTKQNPTFGEDKSSSRFTRIQNHRERAGQLEEDKANHVPSNGSTEESVETRRLERFLAAGGLKILNQWLANASGYDTVPFKDSSVAKSNKTSTAKVQEVVMKRKAPPDRPIVYTILRFLQHIPFNQNVIMSSKINKQVQKIGKRVTSIIEAQQAGKAAQEDLENWTSDETLSSVDALVQIREAVNAIKSTWREQTTKQSSSIQNLIDPFQALREQIKERLEELTQFESGKGSAPEWYIENPLPSQKINVAAPKKLTKMQEMAALERKAEREKLQQKIKEVKRKNQASLALLREKFRKQREDVGLSNFKAKKKDKEGKQVCWKDGLDTQKMRHRRKLEEVFVYIKGTPSAGWRDTKEDIAATNVMREEQENGKPNDAS